jgi:hypothetical protein
MISDRYNLDNIVRALKQPSRRKTEVEWLSTKFSRKLYFPIRKLKTTNTRKEQTRGIDVMAREWDNLICWIYFDMNSSLT